MFSFWLNAGLSTANVTMYAVYRAPLNLGIGIACGFMALFLLMQEARR